MAQSRPSPWWVPILLSFLGLTTCFLTIAYISWIQIAGQLYPFGLLMTLLNLAATVAAVVATGMDARTGQVAWLWWVLLGVFVPCSFVLFPFMGQWAPR